MLEAFRIGHCTNESQATGVTVIMAPKGAVAGCCVMGNSPATRETDLLRSECTVERINAVVLSGGSAFGLDACSGVMHYMAAQHWGYDTGAFRVPIVAGASLYDLEYKGFAYPDKEMGEFACHHLGEFVDCGGAFGAGCGATVGKLMGMERATPGGLGIATLKVGAVEMCAIVAVNAFGNVYDPYTAQQLAGLTVNGLPCDIEVMLQGGVEARKGSLNTTIGCLVTNARLTKAECNVVAKGLHDAYSRCIRPVHTTLDGDATFVMASGDVPCNVLALQAQATRLMIAAIINAVTRKDFVG